MSVQCAADVHGEWIDPDFASGLIDRCRRNWNVPFVQLSNQVLATFIRQNIATEHSIREAVRRLESGVDDDTELYDGELENSVIDYSKRSRTVWPDDDITRDWLEGIAAARAAEDQTPER